MAEILLFVILLLPLVLLSAFSKKEAEAREIEQKKEDERRARVSALYPEPLSYEERMGVQYGLTGPQNGS